MSCGAWRTKFLAIALTVILSSALGGVALGDDVVSEDSSAESISTTLEPAKPRSLKSEPAIIEEVIIYSSRTETQAASLPATAYRIGPDELALTRAHHISEALVRSPGVWISRGNGQEHLTALRSPVLTGAGACGAFLMAEDNIPLRAAGFCNVNQLFEATSELAESIEVLPGPQSVLYGTNALHGVINVISPSPQADANTTLSLEGGSYDYYRTRLAHANRHWYAGFDGIQSGGHKDDAGFDQQKLKLRHRTYQGDLGITSTAAFTNLNQETAGFITGNDAYQDGSRKKHNPNPEAYRDARSQRVNIRFDYQPDNATQWVFTPYLRHSQMEFLMHFLPWQPVEKNRHYSAGWQSMLRHYLNDQFTLHLGLDGEYTQGELQEVQAGDFSPAIPSGVHYDYRVTAQVVSPFTALYWQMNDKTRLSAGLRYEWLSYDYDNKTAGSSPCAVGVPCRLSRPDDTSDSFNNASWQLGLVQQLSPAHSLYFNIAHGYRAPQATELYRLQSGQIGTDLDAETADNVELGLRGAAGNWQYTLAAYRMKKHDVIFQDSNRHNVSGATTLHRGLELSLYGLLASNWYGDLSASYAKHSYDSDSAISPATIKGNDIDTAPRYTGSARIGRYFTPTSRAELEWVYMGSYYTDPENQHSYRGHRLINLRWQWQATPRWELSVRINNLSDEDYAERADYGFGQERYFVGEPRTGFIELNRQL